MPLANAVAVLAVKAFPVTLPVTLPVKLPKKVVAVTTPLTNMLPPTPRPPVTVKAPVLLEFVGVLFTS